LNFTAETPKAVMRESLEVIFMFERDNSLHRTLLPSSLTQQLAIDHERYRPFSRQVASADADRVQDWQVWQIVSSCLPHWRDSYSKLLQTVQSPHTVSEAVVQAVLIAEPKGQVVQTMDRKDNKRRHINTMSSSRNS
jgi:hypothetical protein